jgi:hypothetical protein
MEVAGVVLGAIPVIAYALKEYQDVRETTRAFRHWKATLGTLKGDIFLQERQLYVTLHTFGIELTDHTTMADVENTLRHTHPTQCNDIIHILQEMDSMINQIAQHLIPDMQGPVSLEFYLLLN